MHHDDSSAIRILSDIGKYGNLLIRNEGVNRMSDIVTISCETGLQYRPYLARCRNDKVCDKEEVGCEPFYSLQ